MPAATRENARRWKPPASSWSIRPRKSPRRWPRVLGPLAPASHPPPADTKEIPVAVQIPQASQTFGAALIDIAPGFILSAAVAALAYLAAPYLPRALPIPAMVLALLIGIALNPIANRPAVRPGMAFCIRKLLRWAVALLGLRVALSDIAALGLATGVMIVAAMI